MQDLSKFVKQSRFLFSKYWWKSRVESDRWSIVMGNVSADMDSVIGSLLFALCLQTEIPNRIFFPVINCPKPSFSYRKDIVQLLSDHSIYPEDLIFFEELTPAQPLTDLYLFDHHQLDSKQSHLPYTIRGIIDHHLPHPYPVNPPFEPFLISPAASACTLLYERYPFLLSPIWSANHYRLLLAPIYIDSNGFSPSLANQKWFPGDKRVYTTLQSTCLDLDTNYFDRLSILKKQSNDVQSLGLSELVKLDYKSYDLRGWRYGISTVLVGFADLIAKVGESDFLQIIREFMRSEGLNLFVLATVFEAGKEAIYVGPNDPPETVGQPNGANPADHRTNFPGFFEQICSKMEASEVKLQREASIDKQAVWYIVGNTVLTRKTTEPILRRAISEVIG